ncbi:1,5-anhydro-D-fructose reductase-like [Oppia nitens]|uniref:1,5-anhydro-D-fructose reductase-like n=1 Tax=Oppia nitens TaxID=1686743 RepID=UPI0023DBDB82|nr:1,5-anhydro-D-fructose reductase-like [Oppia nitens]
MVFMITCLIGFMLFKASPRSGIVKLVQLNNGHYIPAIGLGTWTMDDKEAREAIKMAVKIGYRHVDTAWRYHNEKGVGQALKDLILDKVIARNDIFITTKVWNTFHGRELAVQAIKESLANLGLDYLDLALIHWPTGFKAGTDDIYPRKSDGSIMPSDFSLIDTWKGMEDLFRQGLAKSIGVSNFNIKQLQRVLNEASIKPSVNQFETHPFLAQQELVDFCHNNSIAVIAYSPLRQADKELLNNPVLKNIALKYNKTVAQVALRWQIDRNVIIIAKSSRKERQMENINIFDFKLEDQEIKQITALNQNNRLIDIPGIQNHPEYPFDN